MNYATTGMTYARFFPSDWRTGCLTLNLEEEGLYVRVCMFMYDTGRALVDDDAWASHALRVHIHKYRKVMGSLIAKGKIIRAQGVLINERVIEEFDRWKMAQAENEAMAKRRSEAAKRREENKAHLQRVAEALEKTKATQGSTPHSTHQSTPPVDPRVYPGVATIVSPQLPTQSTGKNSNEINAGNTTAVPEQCHNGEHRVGGNLESIVHSPEKKEERENKTTTVEQDAARGGGLYKLNGSADVLVQFISEYADVPPKVARDMLTSNIKAYTAETILQAHSLTLAKMATSSVGNPYRYLIGAAQKIREGKIKPGKGGGFSRFGRGAR